jgi:hypothetical protein
VHLPPDLLSDHCHLPERIAYGVTLGGRALWAGHLSIGGRRRLVAPALAAVAKVGDQVLVVTGAPAAGVNLEPPAGRSALIRLVAGEPQVQPLKIPAHIGAVPRVLCAWLLHRPSPLPAGERWGDFDDHKWGLLNDR